MAVSGRCGQDDSGSPVVRCAERVARFLELAEAVGDVVAVDVGDAEVVPAAGGQLARGGGEPGGVQPAGVGDDADPVRHQVVERGRRADGGR